MRRQDLHISDDDLLRHVDGELSNRRAAEVHAHLAACQSCRMRAKELDETITAFVATHHEGSRRLPSAQGARALLKLRMAELLQDAPASRWRRTFYPKLAWIGIAAMIFATLVLNKGRFSGRFREVAKAELVVPDPRLTPGAVLPVTREQVCAESSEDMVPVVPARIAHQVFAAYGIREPKPRAYEVDYLITPALGGGDNIRNFWPQPYHASVWNAHVKDALEDHLHRLVCEGDVDLATAQRDIASDWTAAYRKYFRTETPLPEHAQFLKDRPWE